MLKVIACLVFFISSFFSLSQTIQGRIVDEKGQAVPYAHLQFDKSTVGTISNDSGFFSLQKKRDFTYLNISSIGYTSLKIPAQQLQKERYIFVMEGSQITMEEVVVKGSFDSATWYVQQAIKNIPKNYPKKKHSQIAFYREASVRDSIYSRMVEAIVLLSDRGVNVPLEKTKYEVLRLRKTDDNRNIDWHHSLQNWLYQEAGIFAMNKSNPIKPKGAKNADLNEVLISPSTAALSKETSVRLLNEKFVEDNLFDMVANYQMKGEEFIKIEFKRSGKEFIKFFYTGGYLIIKKDNFAVVEFNRWVKNVRKESDKEQIRANYLIKYKKTGDKYYTDYIRDLSPGTNASRISGIANSEEYYSVDSQKGRIYTVNELFFLENRDYEKISWRTEMSKDDDMYEITSSKRLGFSFESINALPISPINQKMLNELSQNGSIDALFIED